jgi:hypothetical protein
MKESKTRGGECELINCELEKCFEAAGRKALKRKSFEGKQTNVCELEQKLRVRGEWI